MRRALRTAGFALLFLAGSLARVHLRRVPTRPAGGGPTGRGGATHRGGRRWRSACAAAHPPRRARTSRRRAGAARRSGFDLQPPAPRDDAGRRAGHVHLGTRPVAPTDDADLRGGPLGRFRSTLRDAAGEPYRAGAGRDRAHRKRTTWTPRSESRATTRSPASRRISTAWRGH